MAHTIRYLKDGETLPTTPWPHGLAKAKKHASDWSKRNSYDGYEILDDNGRVVWPLPSDPNQLAKRIVDIVTDDD